MESKILDTLSPTKPIPTRQLMKKCGIPQSKGVGYLSKPEEEFVQLLLEMQRVGKIKLVSYQGWIKL